MLHCKNLFREDLILIDDGFRSFNPFYPNQLRLSFPELFLIIPLVLIKRESNFLLTKINFFLAPGAAGFPQMWKTRLSHMVGNHINFKRFKRSW